MSAPARDRPAWASSPSSMAASSRASPSSRPSAGRLRQDGPREAGRPRIGAGYDARRVKASEPDPSIALAAGPAPLAASSGSSPSTRAPCRAAPSPPARTIVARRWRSPAARSRASSCSRRPRSRPRPPPSGLLAQTHASDEQAGDPSVAAGAVAHDASGLSHRASAVRCPPLAAAGSASELARVAGNDGARAPRRQPSRRTAVRFIVMKLFAIGPRCPDRSLVAPGTPRDGVALRHGSTATPSTTASGTRAHARSLRSPHPPRRRGSCTDRIT